MYCRYAFSVRSKIPFTAAHVKVAGAALANHYSIYLIVFVMALGQVIWLGIWSITVFGIYTSAKQESKQNPKEVHLIILWVRNVTIT